MVHDPSGLSRRDDKYAPSNTVHDFVMEVQHILYLLGLLPRHASKSADQAQWSTHSYQSETARDGLLKSQSRKELLEFVNYLLRVFSRPGDHDEMNWFRHHTISEFDHSLPNPANRHGGGVDGPQALCRWSPISRLVSLEQQGILAWVTDCNDSHLSTNTGWKL
ncbi:hypothetical protein PGT21_024098 [Puccinia graminis f. sp. tritici]|uniref:Uncharacterized protein n=1 Tax=Puccinia graminis f. sp. tritici TaxID=56615 RepID=A0A5B0PNI7_PUCGR|nr:hypothetical protein PGT21_024098 [Puccinia graminis f. sp. tritici]